MNILRNVIAVSVAQASDLKGMTVAGVGTVSLPDSVPWEQVSIQVPAKLTIINKVEDKNTVWTATLTFRTCEDRSDRGHACYLLTLADGRRLLLGSRERPFPVTLTSDTLPDNMTDSQMQEVTVTLSSHTRPPVLA
ncbi:MAG: hypothetical protein IJ868_00640 [Prevotella sp.]|nr:hypothetical protein [Prevotella sp.]